MGDISGDLWEEALDGFTVVLSKCLAEIISTLYSIKSPPLPTQAAFHGSTF